MTPALSIIIINYRTPELTVNCLHSIFNETSNIKFEVIVVDNASGDNSREIICGAYPQVRWLQMNYNSGFARANNAGIRQSDSEVVLLLNSDTLNKDNAIEKTFKVFQISEYVACGVQLLNADGTPQISGNYFMPGGLNHLLPLPYVGNVMKFLGNLFQVKKPNIPRAEKTVEVDWINGAFLMVKREATNSAGLMDEDFFLYAEEAEWCSRLKKAGKLCIYGQFNIIHLEGESANKVFSATGKGYYKLSDLKGLQIMLSNFVRIRKQFGVFWYLLNLLTFTVTVPIYFIFGIVDNLLRARNLFSHFSALAGFTSNVARAWTYMPAILSNKPYFYKVL
jgi:GT2 family glycosyltransferase